MTDPTAAESTLRRIRQLLEHAEAESRTDDEREMFAQRAAELMARHSVTEAMVGPRGATADDPIEHRDFETPAPYALQKAHLLNDLAGQMSCHLIRLGKDRNGKDRGCRVYGRRSDLERLAFLYTSLLVQAVTLVGRAYPDHLGNPTPAAVRSYRNAWLLGFASRVAQRMAQARRVATREAETVTPGAELVLADRKTAAERAMRADHPRIRTTSTTVRNGTGYAAGQVAGSRADLGQGRVGTRHRALTS